MAPPQDPTTHRFHDGDVVRSAGGDLAAFTRLVEGHRDYTFRIAFGLLRDRDEAEDAVQESFIRIWDHLTDFKEGMKFTTWLYRIVVNVSYDRIRSRNRRERLFCAFDRLFGGGDPPGGDDPVRPVEEADMMDAVLRLAKRLPPKQCLVFHLRDILDLSIEEAASNAGMSVNSIKVNLCLARRKIRTGLERLKETRI